MTTETQERTVDDVYLDNVKRLAHGVQVAMDEMENYIESITDVRKRKEAEKILNAI